MECGMHEERRRSTKQDKLPDPQVSPVLYDRGHMATTYVENRHWMCCPASFVMSISQLRKMCNISVFLQVFVFGVTQKWLARIHCQPLLTRLPLRVQGKHRKLPTVVQWILILFLT